MDVIEKILAGHREVAEKKDILSKLAKMADRDSLVWDKADTIADFFRKEVREHFALEEKVLFPVLRKILNAIELEALEEIEREHAPILAKLDAFDLVCGNHKRYHSKATSKLMFDAEIRIVELVAEHAKKEDEKLFLHIKGRLQPEHSRELEDLYFRFLKV